VIVNATTTEKIRYVEKLEKSDLQELFAGNILPLSHEYDRLRLQRSDQRYGLDEKQLPPPSATLKPMLGELILMNTCKLHGIRAVTLGLRVALASFVGYTSLEKPLWLWS